MSGQAGGGFSDVERTAIKERAAELRAEKGGKKAAALDDAVMWPTSYAVTGPLGDAQERQIADLVRRAAG